MDVVDLVLTIGVGAGVVELDCPPRPTPKTFSTLLLLKDLIAFGMDVACADCDRASGGLETLVRLAGFTSMWIRARPSLGIVGFTAMMHASMRNKGKICNN